MHISLMLIQVTHTKPTNTDTILKQHLVLLALLVIELSTRIYQLSILKDEKNTLETNIAQNQRLATHPQHKTTPLTT
jgi:hypothetical protein